MELPKCLPNKEIEQGENQFYFSKENQRFYRSMLKSLRKRAKMNEVYDGLVRILSILDDDRSVLKIISVGLGAENEYKVLSVVDLQIRILSSVLESLQEIISMLEKN